MVNVGKDSLGRNELHLAAALGNYKNVSRILSKYSKKQATEALSATDHKERQTPAHYAALYGHVQVLGLLLGTSPNVSGLKDNAKKTPIDYLVSNAELDRTIPELTIKYPEDLVKRFIFPSESSDKTMESCARLSKSYRLLEWGVNSPAHFETVALPYSGSGGLEEYRPGTVSSVTMGSHHYFFCRRTATSDTLMASGSAVAAGRNLLGDRKTASPTPFVLKEFDNSSVPFHVASTSHAAVLIRGNQCFTWGTSATDFGNSISNVSTLRPLKLWKPNEREQNVFSSLVGQESGDLNVKLRGCSISSNCCAVYSERELWSWSRNTLKPGECKYNKFDSAIENVVCLEDMTIISHGSGDNLVVLHNGNAGTNQLLFQDVAKTRSSFKRSTVLRIAGRGNVLVALEYSSRGGICVSKYTFQQKGSSQCDREIVWGPYMPTNELIKDIDVSNSGAVVITTTRHVFTLSEGKTSKISTLSGVRFDAVKCDPHFTRFLGVYQNPIVGAEDIQGIGSSVDFFAASPVSTERLEDFRSYKAQIQSSVLYNAVPPSEPVGLNYPLDSRDIQSSQSVLVRCGDFEETIDERFLLARVPQLRNLQCLRVVLNQVVLSRDLEGFYKLEVRNIDALDSVDRREVESLILAHFVQGLYGPVKLSHVLPSSEAYNNLVDIEFGDHKLFAEYWWNSTPDVSFRCKQGLVHAHRLPLVSASERFAVQLDERWTKRGSHVEVQDVDKDIFVFILKFLYGFTFEDLCADFKGTEQEVIERLIKIWMGSQRLLVRELELKCFETVSEMISLETVVSLSQVSSEVLIRPLWYIVKRNLEYRMDLFIWDIKHIPKAYASELRGPSKKISPELETEFRASLVELEAKRQTAVLKEEQEAKAKAAAADLPRTKTARVNLPISPPLEPQSPALSATSVSSISSTSRISLSLPALGSSIPKVEASSGNTRTPRAPRVSQKARLEKKKRVAELAAQAKTPEYRGITPPEEPWTQNPVHEAVSLSNNIEKLRVSQHKQKKQQAAFGLLGDWATNTKRPAGLRAGRQHNE